MPVYKTTNGNSYQFTFEKQADNTYRAYIVAMPSYGQRNTELAITHRLPDNGRYYVCREPQPRSLEQVTNVAAAWAALTDRYIRTGKPFGAASATGRAGR